MKHRTMNPGHETLPEDTLLIAKNIVIVGSNTVLWPNWAIVRRWG
jgi:hypothetical protein